MTPQRALVLATSLALLGGALKIPTLSAADHGQLGETFPIIETDLLSSIETRLHSLEASGEIGRLQNLMQEQAERSVRRPHPVEGLSPASETREWRFDPSITLQDDIADGKGNLIAARGTRINPLDMVQMRQALVFVDGDNAEELAWAARTWPEPSAKIVFVAGSPFDAMKPWQRRFYFDQGGKLTGHFGIRHTPAVVRADGAALKISEIPLKGSAPVRGAGVPSA